jgi:hypothetical protein
MTKEAFPAVVTASPGYFQAVCKIDEVARTVEVEWWPIIAWHIVDADLGAEPVLTAGTGPSQHSDAILTPGGVLLRDNAQFRTVSEWFEAVNLDAYKLVGDLAAPHPLAPAAEPFSPAAFRPQAAAKRPAAKRDQPRASR